MRLPTLGLLLATGLGVLCTPARAEGEEEMDPVSAEVKAQMEKIIELMRENERALLEISTGGKAAPKQVDVDVTPPPSDAGGSSGQASGSEGSEGSQGGESAPERAREAVRALDEVIRTQRQTGAKIPGELEELVRMVPQ